MNTLFTNYHWENDNNGKDVREYLFSEYAEEEDWQTEDDVPDDRIRDEIYAQEKMDWDDFEYEMKKFIENSPHGFLLVGTCGRWDGTHSGGCYISKFSDLYKFWDSCDYREMYDEKGHLYIKGTHHDGSNYAEIKELTEKGAEYVDNHRYDSDQDVHKVLISSNFYTKLPHYAHKIFGCKKGV